MRYALLKTAGLAGVLVAGVVLTACGGGTPKEAAQSSICSISSPDGIKECLEGQLMWFRPERWGNEQMPLLIVAAYCDTNHQVIMNNSGVICTHTRKRLGTANSAGK